MLGWWASTSTPLVRKPGPRSGHCQGQFAASLYLAQLLSTPNLLVQQLDVPQQHRHRQ
jgi:hypothetical protein